MIRPDLVGAATAVADSVTDDVRATLTRARDRDALHRHKRVTVDAAAVLALVEAVDRLRAGQRADQRTGNIKVLADEADAVGAQLGGWPGRLDLPAPRR